MLKTILSPFTTARASGVAFRDVFIMVGVLLGALGSLGVLSPEQVETLRRVVEDVSGQWPQIIAAVGVLMTIGMSIYRAIFKSSSDKAADVGKRVDADLPGDAPVVIKTAAGQPDIVVMPKAGK